jgi:hypothetical protein
MVTAWERNGMFDLGFKTAWEQQGNSMGMAWNV